MQPFLSVIFTGGTISMTHVGSDGAAVPTLSGLDICKAIPALDQFDMRAVDFGQYPGPHMTPERVLQLYQVILQQFSQGAQAVIVTHGTDTLEETAYLLDLLHTDERPIILVGAMRTSDDLSWDGPVNLYGACLVGAHALSRGRGVLVVMNNTIHAASEVTKTYTEALDTFVSPNLGPMGVIDLNQIIYFRHVLKRIHLPYSSTLPRVELIDAYSGCDGSLVRAAVDLGAKGIVVSAMGRGNVPVLMADRLIEAMEQGVLVGVCSRCWGGRVAPVYGYLGGGAYLLEKGALFIATLNAAKARIALSLCLSAGYSKENMLKFFV